MLHFIFHKIIRHILNINSSLSCFDAYLLAEGPVSQAFCPQLPSSPFHACKLPPERGHFRDGREYDNGAGDSATFFAFWDILKYCMRNM
jgi:hypothetical protein